MTTATKGSAEAHAGSIVTAAVAAVKTRQKAHQDQFGKSEGIAFGTESAIKEEVAKLAASAAQIGALRAALADDVKAALGVS